MMRKIISIGLLTFSMTLAFGQTEMFVHDIVDVANSLSKSEDIRKHVINDRIFDVNTQYLQFELNDSLKIRIGERIASETDSNYYYGMTEVISIVKENEIVKIYGVQNENCTRKVKEIIVTDLANIPKYGFIFNDSGSCIIFNEYFLTQYMVIENVFFVNNLILLHELDLLLLSPKIVTSKSDLRFISNYPKENGLVTLFIR